MDELIECVKKINEREEIIIEMKNLISEYKLIDQKRDYKQTFDEKLESIIT